jgi:hypothetical protein
MKGFETEAEWVTAFADGDSKTNMGLDDVTDGPARIAYPARASASADVRDESLLVSPVPGANAGEAFRHPFRYAQ